MYSAPFLIVLLFFLLATGVWVSLSLMGVALVTMEVFTPVPSYKVLASAIWTATASWPLTALPLFIWMGEILFRTRLAEDMFAGLAPWLNRLPGRLVHINVVGCGIFAAVSGSSAATAATIGRLTLPLLEQRGYDRALSVGSLAASGSLGMLIPPSIVMIVYGVSAEVSIARLFLAGVVPGLMLMALFMAYVAYWAMRHPDRVPNERIDMPILKRFAALARLMPVVLLIITVIGSIYTGIATPTEAAAVGVLGALVIAFAGGALTFPRFTESLTAAVMTSCMIIFIMACAAFLSMAMGFIGLPRAIGAWVASMGFSAVTLIVVLTVFYIVLGCFLDGISMIVLTTAVVLPAVQAVGIDLLWFGVYVVIVVEMSQITPPVGFNLFVVQSISGDNILRVAQASAPFFLLMIVAIALILVFPGLATWLPTKVM